MARMKSTTAGQKRFAQIANPQIERSSFNRSCGNKLTLDGGELVPIFVDEALPGDTFKLQVSLFGRIATLLQPIMDNVTLDTFFFAVPYRLVWDNWHKFMGEEDNPGDSTDFLIPQMVSPSGGYLTHSLSDYFGIPTEVEGITHSSLYHRAYNLIFNEWFRHQDLQNSVIVDKDDGPDVDTDYPILKRGKRHDYFTSCLPWPQKGDPVLLPLGDTAPVSFVGQEPSAVGDGTPKFNVGSTPNIGITRLSQVVTWEQTGTDGTATWNNPRVKTPLDSTVGVADLSLATATTINAIRQAFQVQRLLERDARGGTRYTEIIRSHFGVTSPDQRLQRPEYLGGGAIDLKLQSVPNTTDTGTGKDQAELAAFGTITGQGHGFVQSFTEHCLVIGLVCLRADLNYQQGLERMFSRRTKVDFYWPTLAHLGEQAVLNQEIYAQGTAGGTDDTDVFGYQERYAEYRYKPSRICGRFRSIDAVSLDIWHLAQEFGALPVLDTTFIEEDPPFDRVIAVPAEPHLLLDCYFTYNCARPMPIFSVPGMVDHF